MGLGSLIEDAKDLALLLRVRKRFKEDVMLKGFLMAAYAAASFVVVSAIAQLTGACPALLGALQPALLAALGGAVTFWLKRPEDKPGVKATGAAAVLAALAAGFVAFKVEIARVCGADFFTQLPTLLSMGAMIGLGLYLRSPKRPASSIDPKRFVQAIVALAFLGLTACGSLAQVRVGGEAKPTGPDQRVVEGLVCQAREVEAGIYISDRGGSRAEITERIERARVDTAGKPGCACREQACIALREAGK